MAEYLEDYIPPEWAKSLSNIPQHRVKLAMNDTPIHKWNLPGVPDDFQVYIKRDDMTGSTLSGNKVSRLEFIFGDAVASGCRHFITCGGTQSNWCRSVAVAAAQLGMTSHIVMPTTVKTVEDLGCHGNLLITRLCGARMYLAPLSHASQTMEVIYDTHLLPRMQGIAEHIRRETGEKSYICNVGGSNAIGFFGYLDAFQEFMEQGIPERFDDVVLTTGSGGMCEGLAVANYLTGSKVKIHGIVICNDADMCYDHGNNTLRQIGIDVRAEDLYEVIDGHTGQGYAIATQEDYDFIRTVARTTGIILDPTYTGKAARGLVQELRERPDRFRGKRILFLHTGGIFVSYDGRLGEVVSQTSDGSDRISIWNDLEQSPFK